MCWEKILRFLKSGLGNFDGFFKFFWLRYLAIPLDYGVETKNFESLENVCMKHIFFTDPTTKIKVLFWMKVNFIFGGQLQSDNYFFNFGKSVVWQNSNF